MVYTPRSWSGIEGDTDHPENGTDTTWQPNDPPDGGNDPDGCAGALVNIDVNGQPTSTAECVDDAEAQRRLRLRTDNWNTENPNAGGPPTGGTGGGANPGWRPAGQFPTLPPWAAGTPPTFTPPTFTPPPAFDAPEFNWTRELDLPEYTFNEQFHQPSAEEAMLDPGYQFRLKQGQQALENNAASRGTLRTGATLKGLTAYGQDMATQEWNSVYGRARDQYDTRRDLYNDQYGARRAEALDEYNKAFEAFMAEFAANYTGAESEWQHAFETAQEQFDTQFATAQAEFNPQFEAWQMAEAARQRQIELEWQAALQQYFFNNVSATDVLNAGRR